MDTQIVRHDAPYKIIFGGKNGKFALQTATLFVIEEKKGVNANDTPMNERFTIASYPVVSRSYDLEGEVWTDCEQKDCIVICRQGESVSLSTFREVIISKLRHSHVDMIELASQFSIASLLYGFKFIMPTDKDGNIIKDYEVCLEFEKDPPHSSTGDVVVTSKDNHFYFNSSYEACSRGERSLSIHNIAQDRDAYLSLCRREGLRSITFTTKDDFYKSFVRELNNYKKNGGTAV